ncbi:MAG: carbohydrate kinase [Polyangiaceae bacterium]
MKRPLDVITFGEILWDIFEVKTGVFIRELGGAPANVSVNLGALGVRSAVIGGVGQDRFGDDLAVFLARNHVDTRFVIRFPNRTGLTFITHDAHGEPSFLFYRFQTADMAVRASDISAAMGNAKWVLIGTSTLMSPELAKATRTFLQSARKSNAHLVVDLNVRAHLWADHDGMRRAIASVLKNAMLVKASAADLAALSVGNETKALAWVRSHAKDAEIVITRGGGRAEAIGAHERVSAATRRKKCVDATGAGDAFIAGVLATLIAADASPSGESWKNAAVWKRALQVGHMLGSVAIAKRGSVSGITTMKKADLEKVRRMLAPMREGGR